MTKWTPNLQGRPGPIYRAIVDAMAEDIAKGTLPPGTRLPPQRELAWALKVTLGTVTRAYSEAAVRGLVGGEVGRGTYVLGRSNPDRTTVPLSLPPVSDVINLLRLRPAPVGVSEALAATLRQLADGAVDLSFTGCEISYEFGSHRDGAAAWLERQHRLKTDPARILVTSGGQHALFSAMSAVTAPGDIVLAENLCFAGIRWTAPEIGVKLEGLPLDAEGVVPDAFEAACRARRPRAVVLTPTLQHPTTAVMSAERRREIGDIARRHGVVIIEDDVLGYLTPDGPPPIAATHPDITVYLTSLSKSIDTSIRVGYLVAPEHLFTQAKHTSVAAARIVPPLYAEIATRWISDGTADRLAASQRAECAVRMDMLRAAVPDGELAPATSCIYGWLNLPPGRTATRFVAEAHRAGVDVLPSEFFAIGRDPTQAIRINVAGTTTREELQRGLTILSELLRRPEAADIALA